MTITQTIILSSQSSAFGITGCDSVASYFCISKVVAVKVAMNVGQLVML